MNIRIVCVAVTVGVVGGPACASLQLQNAPLNKGTIELWRDAGNTCHINTTPYFRVKKGRDRKVEWKINDPLGMRDQPGGRGRNSTRATAIRLPSCNKKNRRKIECALREDTPAGAAKYSVWLGNGTGGPESSRSSSSSGAPAPARARADRW